jgi:hypothetical protein
MIIGTKDAMVFGAIMIGVVKLLSEKAVPPDSVRVPYLRAFVLAVGIIGVLVIIHFFL